MFESPTNLQSEDRFSDEEGLQTSLIMSEQDSDEQENISVKLKGSFLMYKVTNNRKRVVWITLTIFTCLVSAVVLVLMGLDFGARDILDFYLQAIWQTHSGVGVAIIFILILSATMIIITSVFICMFELNIGFLTGIKLDHQTNLLTLLSLTQFLSLFTLPAFFLICHLFLSVDKYESTFFYQNIKSSDFINIGYIPFPVLITPFFFVMLVFFMLGVHVQVLEKLGYYLYGIKTSNFGTEKDKEVDRLIAKCNVKNSQFVQSIVPNHPPKKFNPFESYFLEDLFGSKQKVNYCYRKLGLDIFQFNKIKLHCQYYHIVELRS